MAFDLPRILDNVRYSVNRGDHGEMVWHIDTDHSRFRGQHLRNLDRFHKRKIENLIIIQHPKEIVKIVFE